MPWLGHVLRGATGAARVQRWWSADTGRAAWLLRGLGTTVPDDAGGPGHRGLHALAPEDARNQA